MTGERVDLEATFEPRIAELRAVLMSQRGSNSPMRLPHSSYEGVNLEYLAPVMLDYIDTLRAQVAALAGAKVYTVEWSDYDGHGIIAAFKTHEEADAELAYCKGAPDDFAPSYYTSEYTLGLSEACSLYRFNADGALMHAYFFTRLGDEERGTVRVYNEPWNDGTCMDVYARSEADARAAIAQHLDAARGGEG